jgi:chemotaxis protein CheC
LTLIFERAAEVASQALTIWLDRPTTLVVSEVDELELAEASELLGAGDTEVAVCALPLDTPLDGQILLVFEDQSGLALADLLLKQPSGTAQSWGEMERSAAAETANIVACALLNSLAAHLPLPTGPDGGQPVLTPGPPEFRHEFAGSLMEFAVMEQAMTSDRVVLARTKFAADGHHLEWSLLFVPGPEAIRLLTSALTRSDRTRNV